MAATGRPGRPGPEQPGRRAGLGLPVREPEAPSGSLAVTTLSRAGVWQDGRLAGRVTVVLCHGVLGLSRSGHEPESVTPVSARGLMGVLDPVPAALGLPCPACLRCAPPGSESPGPAT